MAERAMLRAVHDSSFFEVHVEITAPVSYLFQQRMTLMKSVCSRYPVRDRVDVDPNWRHLRFVLALLLTLSLKPSSVLVFLKEEISISVQEA